MTDAIIQLQPDGTGKDVDVTQLTVGANTVYRQRVQLGGSNAAGLVEPDSYNRLPVSVYSGVASSGNSTTTPLGSSGTFTGTSEDVSGYSAISYIVYADQSGTLSPQFSSNGTNWDDNIESFSIVAGQVFALTDNVEGKYFRVVYSNGATGQSTFRLQTVYKSNSVSGEVFGIGTPPLSWQDGTLTQAVMAGPSTSGGGIYVQPTVTPGGALSVNPTTAGVVSGSPPASAEVIGFNNAGTVAAVTPTVALPISVNSANFIFSTLNSSTSQLIGGGTFTGTIETALNQPAISLLLTSDTSTTLTVYQYIDAIGTYAVPPVSFSIPAGQGFSYSFPLNGNYVRVTATNTNASVATTTFNLNTAYGTIPAATPTGNAPVSINEINGTAIAGAIPVTLASYHQDVFQQLVTSQRQNDFECSFIGNGNPLTLLNLTSTGSSLVTWANGQAQFKTGTTNPSTLSASSQGSVQYRPDSELYAYFTAFWNSNTAGTFQRIGVTDTVNGFFIGYEGTVFSVSKISNGTIVSVTGQTSFNLDTLMGQVGSKFTRAGTPEAINFAYQNVFRIRFGWLGSAPIIYEVLSPDGIWVQFHILRTPNTQNVPSIQNPNLPISVWMSDTGNNLTMGSSCWSGGSSSPYSNVNTPINNQTLVLNTRSIGVGGTAAGGFVNQLLDSTGATVISTSAPINDAQLMGAQTQDQPIFTAIAGDPSGDWNGQNLLELLMDDGQMYSLGTRLTNVATDINKALIISDAPQPIRFGGVTGYIYTIDTTGYQSLNITTGVGFAANVTTSDELGGVWSALTGTPRVLGTYVSAVAASLGYSFPVVARFIRFTLTSPGTATAYLRSTPWQANYTTSVPTGTASNNIAQLAGSAPPSAGVAGVFPVGGNIATGVAPTANPVYVAGIDTGGKTRPILTDTSGRPQGAIIGVDPATTQRQVGVSAPGLFNMPALGNTDLTVADGRTLYDIMTLVLKELQIANQQRAELYTTGLGLSINEPDEFRNDTTWVANA